jgi:hypothetical protein
MADELSRATPGRSSAPPLTIAERHRQARCLAPPRWAPVAHTRSQPSTEAPRALHHSSRPHGRRQFEPRRAFCPASPPAIAGTSTDLRTASNGILGEPTPFTRPFLAKPGLPLAGFRWFPSLAAARDYIARSEVFLGARTQNPGTCLKKLVFRSRVSRLNLVKSLANRRNIRKIQTQLCWFPGE